VTARLIKERYLWSTMSKDIGTWVATCEACQRAKVHRHNRAELQRFPAPSARFADIHVDIVGPLPESDGYSYLLTAIDRFTRWPEAIPMRDMTADSCARALLSGWIARFGVPCSIVTDQGRQFESELWARLSSALGIQRSRTTAYHPQANGMVERFHRSLKATLRAKLVGERWSTELPVVMLGLRAAVKEELKCCPAQLVYGTTLRLPGYYADPEKQEKGQHEFLEEMQRCVKKFVFSETGWHSRQAGKPLARLHSTSHVMMLVPPGARQSLDPVYTGPHRVLARSSKHFKIDVNGTQKEVSVDRLKPAVVCTDIVGPEDQEGAEVLGRTKRGRAIRRPERFRVSFDV
jgi:transposase InsO family protein